MSRRPLLALALAAGVGAGCSGGAGVESGPTPAATSPATDRVLPACVRHAPGRPEGFREVGMREVRERDHRGIHVRYRGPGGSAIHYLVGISGEIGEGLPFRRSVSLSDEVTARFLGADGRWVAVWDLSPPCGQAAALGMGLRAREFLRVVAGAVTT